MSALIPQQAQLLYDKIAETLRQEGLTERERIPAYRRMLEEVYRAITSDEKRYFGSLSARMAFARTEYKIPSRLHHQTTHLRVFANKVVHEGDCPLSATDDACCLYALCQAIEYFSGEAAPKFLRDCWEHYQDQFEAVFQTKRRAAPKPSYRLRAVIQDIHVPEHVHTKAHCVLYCDTDELGGKIAIKCWDNRREDGSGADLSRVHEFLQPYNTIYITDVKPYDGREGEYYAGERSLIVLEPDYLLEAKELAECSQFDGDNPLLHLLNRFAKSSVSDGMLLGNLAGQMLDALATDPQFDYQTCFNRMMRENSFSMLCLACKENGKYVREPIRKIHTDGKALEPKLRHALDQFKGKHLTLEPTFISAQYGIQGRLDLLLEDPADPNRKDVVEMKASNAPKRGLYPNHEAQALLYSLLLESTFPGRQGTSAILYARSAPEESPLRDARDDNPARKQALLMLRNRIVANDLRLAAGDTGPIEALLTDPFGPLPNFRETDLAGFRQAMNAASPLLRDWFFEYARFIFREMQTGKTGNPDNQEDIGGFAALWHASKWDKLNNYSALTDLKLERVGADFTITLHIRQDHANAGVTSFRENETVILYPTPNPDELRPLDQQILKCSIVSLSKTEITVRLANKQLDKDYFGRCDYWAIERDFRDSSYKTMLGLLARFLQAPAEAQNRILGLLEPRLQPDTPTHDDAQHPLVTRALSARDYFLIQGPPGTGKTSKVLMELARALDAQGLNIMIIAFTNQAVRIICEKLQEKGIEFIQLGRHDTTNSWKNLSEQRPLNELFEIAARTRIFVSTQATFANSLELLEFKKFHTLIVDEASQLLEPQLAGILPEFERFILIGDDNQLPAVVLQDETNSRSRAPQLAEIGLHNLRDSLFTRLLQNARARGWDHCYGMLTKHYRMHADIAAYPNQHFYEGRLVPALPHQTEPIAWPPSAHPLHPYFQQRVAYIRTQPDPRAKINDEEAGLVVELIRYVHQLYGPRFDPATTVGVITPFRAQIANIRQRLPAEYQSVTIDTVERFQGAERDVILVSFAIKSPLQLRAIQSINEAGVDRKLNVAMTRAKEHLVMMGVADLGLQIADLGLGIGVVENSEIEVNLI